MDDRTLYDKFAELELHAHKSVAELSEIQKSLMEVIERNAELEIENQHLRDHLQELEQHKSSENGGLSKSRKNLEKLYEQGFHVCNVDNMYGTRRLNDEPCVFCQNIIYGERK
ncbi:MAG: DNA replication initiation control protein YabA [Liquorilactobacillus ghanensis]|uniref:DNA replication initiation control protein YabA n=1 Tax=Liquorilactobacillus ghanensis TaxID=399370 RepID=UPI00070F7825|nr:DNA replication initiation control protein YabA [Liquorilactobacillus ghanensis]